MGIVRGRMTSDPVKRKRLQDGPVVADEFPWAGHLATGDFNAYWGVSCNRSVTCRLRLCWLVPCA